VETKLQPYFWICVAGFILGYHLGVKPGSASAKNPDAYELHQRAVQALEAIASGTCMGKPTRQCMPYQTQGVQNADRLHTTP